MVECNGLSMRQSVIMVKSKVKCRKSGNKGVEMKVKEVGLSKGRNEKFVVSGGGS